VDRDTVDEIFRMVLVDSVGTGLKPIAGAVEVLGELAELAEVTVITARSSASPVHDWLQSVFPKSTLPRIRIVAMGAHDDKSQHIHAHGLRYFIDDRAETCVQLSRDGIQPIVFSQPWNENRHQLPVVSSWQEIRALCL
jgi:5'(3')-deoxyribonucleotidase